MCLDEILVISMVALHPCGGLGYDGDGREKERTSVFDETTEPLSRQSWSPLYRWTSCYVT